MEIYNKIINGLSKNYKILSKFYNMNPLVNILYFFGIMTIVFILNNPIFLISFLLVTVVNCILYCGLKIFKQRLIILLMIIIFSLIMNPLFNHRGTHILFYIFDNPVTLEASFYGIATMMVMLNIFISFFYMNLILDSNKILFAFSRTIPQTAFILNMALRYSSYIANKALDIRDTLKTRGLFFSSGGIKNKVFSNSKVLESLTICTLEEGLSIAQGLRAKNYGSSKRTFYNKYPFRPTDKIMVVFCISILIILIAFSINGIGRYTYYPSFGVFKFSGLDVLAYVLSMIYFLIPTLSEIFFHLYRKFNN